MNRIQVIHFVMIVSFLLAGASTALSELPANTSSSNPVESSVNRSVGTVDFPISCGPVVQTSFNRGVAMLHHMMYAQSRELLSSLAADHPDCAMLQWGIAMTHLHPLWAPPKEDELRKGEGAVLLAESLKPENEREKYYIQAIKSYYDDWHNRPHPERLEKWAAAQAELAENYPDDIDAAAFNALALLATAPKADKTFTNHQQAGAILEKINRDKPLHPAGYHYLIHAYDNPLLAQKALLVARGYGAIAPDIPHALHMPTHIFVRLGSWEDVINWNIRSAEVAWNQPVGEATSLHFAHAIDYLVYGYMQLGDEAKAAEALELLLEVETIQDSFASAYAIAAAQARIPMEQENWQQAADLPLRHHTTFPWENYPWFEAITYFSRGVGAARSGDLDAAHESLAELENCHQKTIAAKENYWAVLVDSQRNSVAAWITLADGDQEQALELMTRAADLEDSVDKHPVTPGSVLPARELLGDMLFTLQRYDEARHAYESALDISVNRLRSLHGAARSAEMAGDKEAAGEYYRKVMALQNASSSDRQEFRNASNFLK
ncbi:tetratricopeptide repeat protein [Desulfosediminicola ganghwensis]|uniref:tetratricopeptide repeat protein n=1 Tax=Desulfosediminicola ganghwensis TaxID=2569540 RepID=UPI0010AB9185|nr:tetratricopeptide repeat protein [Desulfosediminicola ganghwensis]